MPVIRFSHIMIVTTPSPKFSLCTNIMVVRNKKAARNITLGDTESNPNACHTRNKAIWQV